MSAAETGPAARRGNRLLGVASQLLNAATNAATAYVAALLLGPDEFGPFAIAFAVVTIVTATARGFLGLTIITLLPTRQDDDRSLAGSAIGLAIVVGAAASLVTLAASAWVDGLVHFAGWVLFAVVHDACRHVAFAEGRQGRALAIDVAWGGVQAIVVGAYALLGAITQVAVVHAWGLGAVGGLVAFALIDRLRLGSPVAWWRAARRHAGWYVAGSLLGQVEFYATILIVGLTLTSYDAGGVRATQLLTAQPTIALLGALLAQSIPRAAVAFHVDRGDAARPVLVSNLSMIAPVVALMLVIAAARAPLMDLLLPDYADDFTDLVVPTAAFTIAVALSLPAVVVLRGMLRLGVDFWLLAGRVATTLAVLPVAFGLGSVTSGLWAGAAVQLVGTAATWVIALRLGRRLEPRTTTEPAPG